MNKYPTIELFITQAKEDLLPGGNADDAEASQFDPQGLADGLVVEMEHTNDPMIALEIAMDHLVEDPEYYIKLKEMEETAEESAPEESAEEFEMEAIDNE